MKTNFKAQNLFARLDAAIVEQAKHDLVKVDDRYCVQAAMYFFLDGTGDENDPKTFACLCMRNVVDPEKSAKAIWDQLDFLNQSRILRLLEEAGFKRTNPILIN